MHKSNSRPIDFDFFETSDIVKLHGFKDGQNNCSKIITTAVIESNPLPTLDFLKSSEENTGLLKEKYLRRGEQSDDNRYINSLSSSASSIEKTLLEELSLDESLRNCLAYNDDLSDTREFSSSLGGNECSEMSLSDSTFTTVTSDFSSISPLSSTSQSCSVYDEPCVSSENSDKGDCNENLIYESTEVIQGVLESEQGRQEDSPDKLTDSNCDFDDCSETNCPEGEKENIKDCDYKGNPVEASNNTSELEEELGDISINSHSSPLSQTFKTQLCRGSRLKKRECNLTFSREEIIKIERDNLILLKKIMAYSKPRSLSLHEPFGHKKTTAAINRARQQKKIEQDNYILYNKICALRRMKKVL